MFNIRNKNVKFDRYGLYSDHNQLGDNKRSLGATFGDAMVRCFLWYSMHDVALDELISNAFVVQLAAFKSRTT
jgi:hypothetical protein